MVYHKAAPAVIYRCVNKAVSVDHFTQMRPYSHELAGLRTCV